MRQRDFTGLIAILALLALGGWGVLTLFRLRFVAGDIYPPYSSLRADPLGTRALHDGLRRLPGMEVGRNLRPLERLAPERETTLLVLGLEPSGWEETDAGVVRSLERFAEGGGRVVVALSAPEQAVFAGTAARGGAGTNAVPVRRTRRSGGGPGVGAPDAASLAERWGLAWVGGTGGGSNALQGVRAAGAPEGLPETIPWLGHGQFVSAVPGTNGPVAGEAWTRVYTAGPDAGGRGESLVVERRQGRGSVVVCAESFLFSNESLRHRREAAWLAWIVGSGRRVVFDEAHLGVVETPGVGTLIRRYRLHGLFAGAVLLAGLWVWHRAAPFVPRANGGQARGELAVRGRDSASGLVSLLRRHLAPGDLLAACYTEWRRTCARSGGAESAKADRMQTVVVREANLAPRERDPLGAYREMVRIWEPHRDTRRRRRESMEA